MLSLIGFSYVHALPLRGVQSPERIVLDGAAVSSLQKGKEVGIDRGRFSCGHAVRKALVDLQCPVLHKLCRQQACVGVRDDLVVIAMHHQHRNRDLLEILREIGLRESDDAIVVSLRAPHHALPPPVLDNRLRGFGPRSIETIKRARGQVAIELRAIGRELGLQSVEDFLGKPARIGLRLHHQRRHRAYQDSLRYPAFAMPPYITCYLTAAGRMADVDGILQIEMRRQGCQVVCIMIHVVAIARLTGSAVASSVMCDDAVAVTEEEQHLRVPVVGRKWPTVAENEGLTFAPVFVENFGAVFCFDGAHFAISLAISRGFGFCRCVFDCQCICRQAAEPRECNATDQNRPPSCERVISHGHRTLLPAAARRGAWWTPMPSCYAAMAVAPS